MRLIDKEVLDEVEKDYLSAVLEPFRNKVTYIGKYSGRYREKDYEYISVYFEKETEIMNFPLFKKGTMYKGMEANRDYAIEELGL